MKLEKKKMSNAKLVALIISVALHAVVFFYLGRMALDYALPKGEVSSLEMNFDTSKGTQLDTTQVDVVETKEIPAPPAAPIEKPKNPAPSKPVVQLPSKEATEEPLQDQQGTEPVLEAPVPQTLPKKDITEEPAQPTVEEPAPEKSTTEDIAADNPPEIVPAAAAETVPAATESNANSITPAVRASDQAYGTPLGTQTEALVPFGTNKSHTYPYLARFRKYEGVTVVHYTVSPSGDVTDANVVTSSGHSVLDDEAVNTIKTWKFKPMHSEVVYEKYVRFQLKGDAREAPSLLRRTKK